MKPTLALFQNHLPRRVMTGRGQSLKLLEICQENHWQRVYFVSDAGVAAAGLLALVARPLEDAGRLVGKYCEVPPEPPVELVDVIAAKIRESRADAVIALGGGSVMDATKVAALSARHSKAAKEFVGVGKACGRGIPTVLIPTTAGTGSEATFVAILTDPQTGNKVGVVDPCLLADIAVVDPALTDRLPAAITASAGMDALVHAIEAYIATVATPIARALALESARHLGASLELVCREPSNTTARDGMAIGSHLAGMAFANSSCCAVHALSLPLGGRYSIPHGVIIGCFAGEMMRHNAPSCGLEFSELASALGWGALGALEFCDRLDRLAESIGLWDQLRKTHVPAEMFGVMARDAVAIRRLMDPNPRDVTERDAERIYRTVLTKNEKLTKYENGA